MKVLIVNNNMQVGGIQKALSNLLSEISGLYDVSLLLFYPEGDLMEDIGKNVKVIKGNFIDITWFHLIKNTLHSLPEFQIHV